MVTLLFCPAVNGIAKAAPMRIRTSSVRQTRLAGTVDEGRALIAVSNSCFGLFMHRSYCLILVVELALSVVVLTGCPGGFLDPSACDVDCGEVGYAQDSEGNDVCECAIAACVTVAPAPHANPMTGACESFQSACDVPDGWAPCCVENGVLYAPGAGVPTDALCTACACRDNGQVECLATPCDPPVCTDANGTTHQPGATFASDDACNTCTCLSDGSIACTEMACACEHPECSCFYGDIEIPRASTLYLENECLMCTCELDGTMNCLPMEDCVPCEVDCDPVCIIDDSTWALGETRLIDECALCTCTASGAVSCEFLDGCIQPCVVDGVEYPLGGLPFDAPDGCNTCTCGWHGVVTCTEMACCADENGDGVCDVDCTYDGVGYTAGDTFPSTDGCNSCTCDTSGYVACTAMACVELADCDGNNAMCDAIPPSCDTGLVPSVVDGCWGPCVAPEQCAHVNQCDGVVICAMPPPACGPGEVPVVENGCFGACIAEEDC
jgi:hypothetical protein